MKKIPRSICIRLGCHDISLFKRLCPAHYAAEYPDQPVSDYRFTWSIVESFEGVVRATTEAEARRMVERGIVAGLRLNPHGMPEDIELLETLDVSNPPLR